MIRTFLASLGIAAAALAFAAPAVAAPCGESSMSSVEYALEQVIPDPLPGLSPGASCSKNSDCGDSENCEGGSCCVKSGSSCTGLGYCCGHPSQGCVDGTCPS